jgi:hypothetical protein
MEKSKIPFGCKLTMYNETERDMIFRADMNIDLDAMIMNGMIIAY